MIGESGAGCLILVSAPVGIGGIAVGSVVIGASWGTVVVGVLLGRGKEQI